MTGAILKSWSVVPIGTAMLFRPYHAICASHLLQSMPIEAVLGQIWSQGHAGAASLGTVTPLTWQQIVLYF